MFPLLILLAATAAATKEQWHPAVTNAMLSEIRRNSPANLFSVSNGAPVSYCEANNTRRGDLIRNTYFMDHTASLVHERIPARPVHALGSGAFGYFEVTDDISHICKASFLKKIGKRTPIAVRFSSAIGERGSSELLRGPRGFAVKFYTEEGNLDILGTNIPVFFTNDPTLFTKFVYATKKQDSNLSNPTGILDFILEHPESINMLLRVFGDLGIPASYRNMPGYSVHTMQVVNEQGEPHFIRWHFTPDAGIKHLGTAEAQNISATDPSFYTRDLFNAIKNSDFPRWTVSVQHVTEEDVKTYGYDIFDVSKTLPLEVFPLQPVGKMVLNSNPVNYFAMVEQIAFWPSNLVHGILGAPDMLYSARRFAYRDSQMRRMGSDVDKVQVNCPLHSLSYKPNPSDKPGGYKSEQKTGLIQIEEYDADNLDQATEYIEKIITRDEQKRTIENIVVLVKQAERLVQKRIVKLLKQVHPVLGDGVAQGLKK